ncbi:MAG TPA: YkvA family protein [Pseudolabrys sp.]|nr:YkvA family protein [Pseudolabrys sp.]
MRFDFAYFGSQAQHSSDTDEWAFQRHFWRKLQSVAASLPFIEDLLAAYYCAFDRETPGFVKTSLLAALAYFVLPADAVPDLLPLLGFADDAAVLAGAMNLLATHIRPEHRALAKDKLREFGRR